MLKPQCEYVTIPLVVKEHVEASTLGTINADIDPHSLHESIS